MARTKKTIKAKEPIKIRLKPLANGNQSIYFDIYRNGKRTYEFLKFYLIPETSLQAKQQNVATMQTVEIMKAQRIIDLQNEEAGIKVQNQLLKNITLQDWLESYKKSSEDSYRSKHRDEPDVICERAVSIQKLIVHINKFRKDKPILLSKLDKGFCLSFIEYLRSAHNLKFTKTEKEEDRPLLGDTTIQIYYGILNSALKLAVKKELIPLNPLDKLTAQEKPTAQAAEREYLTLEELKTLVKAECPHPSTRRAFLFSCFTGIRYSDIIRLTWENVKQLEKEHTVSFRMHKTGKHLDLPLAKDATSLLPERGDAGDNDKIFDLCNASSTNLHIKAWCENAKIDKHITFHCARHTFATLTLTLGADLYTVSSLLGHSKVTTTQIYAKIVDEKKRTAVNLLDNLV